MKSASNYKTLHRAPFVLPVTSPMLEDGGVLTADGKIIAVAPFAELCPDADQVVEHEDQVLTPALINCHAHLELTYLAASEADDFSKENITDWIIDLLNRRENSNAAVDEIVGAARKALRRLHAGGVALTADIGNNPASCCIADGSALEVMFFNELMGVSSQAVEFALQQLELKTIDDNCTAHALYSTKSDLVLQLKKRCRQNSHLFPIHVAESRAEIEFLQDRQGAFIDFFKRRGNLPCHVDLPDDYVASPGCGAVEYMAQLDILDDKTLCVHTVHVSESEVELLAKSGAHVCLCPGSNRFLGVGIAPVSLFVKHGIMPCLGTDSLASNLDLSLWREMQILREDHPTLSAETIFSFATIAGARALGVADRLGSLQVGKSAIFLAVSCLDIGADNLAEFLATAGSSIKCSWVES